MELLVVTGKQRDGNILPHLGRKENVIVTVLIMSTKIQKIWMDLQVWSFGIWVFKCDVKGKK